MARIIPFRGFRYNPDKISALKDVVTPPYDVISDVEQQACYEKHPYNMVRLILGKIHPGDSEADNRYTRSAHDLNEWLDNGVLVQDQEPCLYAIETDFEVDGQRRTRFGFIALVELEELGKGGIHAHEQTFSATKADRLRLMESCKANFCPVFSVFPDPENSIATIFSSAFGMLSPYADFDDAYGCRHRVWSVSDPSLQKRVAQEMSSKALYIADGHHRYETALKYCAMARSRGAVPGKDVTNFLMMYLCSTDDPGLVVRPTHRLLRNVPAGKLTGNVTDKMGCFEQTVREYFDIEIVSKKDFKRQDAEVEFVSRIGKGAGRGAVGVAIRGDNNFYVLQVKAGVMDSLFPDVAPELRRLDVTMVTKLLVTRIFGLDDAALDEEGRVRYVSQTGEALRAVEEQGCDVALILNPTRLSQVREVSEAGLVMPRKSTYFYPKAMSGFVINRLLPSSIEDRLS